MKLFLIFLSTLYISNALFCKSKLENDKMLCADGNPVNSNGCCADPNKYCPPGCGGGWKSSNGVRTCTCNCSGGNGPSSYLSSLSESQRYLKSHNYFRCLHGVDLLAWDTQVYNNAKGYATQCPFRGGLAHSDSYGYTPSSGENLAAGQSQIEGAVEGWYNEIQFYDPATGGKKAGHSNEMIGHYTALMWKTTKKLGCAGCNLQTQYGVYYICNYADSAPNSGRYLQNLPSTNSLVKTEAQCCDTIYGDQTLSIESDKASSTESSMHNNKNPKKSNSTESSTYTDGGAAGSSFSTVPVFLLFLSLFSLF